MSSAWYAEVPMMSRPQCRQDERGRERALKACSVAMVAGQEVEGAWTEPILVLGRPSWQWAQELLTRHTRSRISLSCGALRLALKRVVGE